MSLNENVIILKILGLVNLYNFDIKFDIIQDHIKSFEFICMGPFVGEGHAVPAPENHFCLEPAIIHPKKCIFRSG